MRDCGWIKEAEAIDEALSWLPTGPLDGNQPENLARQFDAIRAVAERIKTILTVCLSGMVGEGNDAPADNGNGGAGSKGKRGPKGPRYDAQEDKRILDGWRASGEKTIEGYARKECHAVSRQEIRRIKLAINRASKRLQRKGLK